MVYQHEPLSENGNHNNKEQNKINNIIIDSMSLKIGDNNRTKYIIDNPIIEKMDKSIDNMTTNKGISSNKNVEPINSALQERISQISNDRVKNLLNKEYNGIIDFLQECPAIQPLNKNGKSVFTHTSIGYPQGSYFVPEGLIDKTYDLLEKSLQDGQKIHLTEKPTNPSPIKIDLDFRFDYEESKRKYTKQHIIEMVKIYNKIIHEYVDVPLDQINAFVFERPFPYKFKGNTKDGVHIIYPDIVIDTTIQHLIRDKALILCVDALSNLPLKNSFDDVIDYSVISKNNWLMYGCSKPGLPPYKLTGVYDFELNEQDISNYNKMSYLIRHLSNFCQGKAHFQLNKDELKQKELEQKHEDLASKKRKVLTTKSSANNRRLELSRNFILTKRRYRNKCSDASLNEIKKLVDLLDSYRADSYEHWMEVGWCLHNIDDTLLDVWIDFSKKSERFEKGKCEDVWLNMKDEGLGIGSLHRWAKIDNPDKYSEVMRNSVRNYILKSVSCTTYDVAQVVFELYKYQYKCTSVKHNVWYEFRNHRWHEIDSAIGLKKRISNDVLNQYLYLVGHYTSNAIVKKDEDKDQYLVKSKALTDVTYKLRDYTFKAKVLKECTEFFHDETFFSKLDLNPDLIGFENGVYDLKKSEFRDGRPEDCISISTGNDYMEFEENDELLEEIKIFMSQIFPNSKVREYMFILMSSFLYGKNVEQKFHIFTGGGGNGKSVLIDLFEMTYGDYCCKLPITLLTQKRTAAGAPNPELAKARPARFASMQEPSEKETLNIGLMKELTGGDKIQARALFGAPFEFKPKFKLILCCNHLPKVPPNDDATWRRLRVVEFISKFTDNPDPNNPLEFQKDEYLSEKLFTWKEAFMYILLQYYKVYRKNGIKEPADVKRATSEYQKMCDIYVEFVADTMEKYNDSVLKITETYQAFKIWYKANYDGKCPTQRDFKAGVSKKLGKYIQGRGGGWHNWRFIPDAESDGEEDIQDNVVKQPIQTTVIKKKIQSSDENVDDADIDDDDIVQVKTKVPIKPISKIAKIKN